MLMGADDGGVDDEVFIVRTFTQLIENTLPNAVLRPSAETLEHAVPITKLAGQIAPRCSRAGDPENAIDEAAVILAAPPLVTIFARTKRLYAPPLRIGQISPNQARPLPVASLNHISESVGIPNVNTP